MAITVTSLTPLSWFTASGSGRTLFVPEWAVGLLAHEPVLVSHSPETETWAFAAVDEAAALRVVEHLAGWGSESGDELVVLARGASVRVILAFPGGS